MIDPKKIAELDQAKAMLVEAFPPLLWSMFKALVAEGFTEVQAFELVKTYIAATFSQPK